MRRKFKYLCFVLTFSLLTVTVVAYGDESPPPSTPEIPSVTEDTTTGAPVPVSADATPLPDDTADENSRPGIINVIFEVSPRQEEGKLYFDVETNLPDGMLFVSTIRDEIGVVSRAGSTMERLMSEVADGKMIIGPFPLGDRSFPSGEYSLYINSCYDDLQPESVMEVIGQEGENLIGRNVFFGMVFFGKEFMITGTKG